MFATILVPVTLIWTACSYSFVEAFANPRHRTRALQAVHEPSEYRVQEETGGQPAQMTEFAALSPGCLLDVQVGDVDLARKAWKKRRRSGSPLLVPCSILSTDRKSVLINNLVYLLRKFGRPISECDLPQRPEGYRSKDIAISIPELEQRHKSHLKVALGRHSRALGYEHLSDLVRDLISSQVEDMYGVKWWSFGDEPWLLSQISQMKGQRLALKSAILQFVDNQEDTMKHTGLTRVKSSDTSGSYEILPLSAALRVSQRSIDTGVVSNGSSHRAAVIGIDPMGDGGLPLLKVTLNVNNKKVGWRMRPRSALSEAEKLPLHWNLRDLKAGDGPFTGTVARLSHRVGAAFIDIGAGWKLRSGKNGEENMTRVLGMLRFDDLVDRVLAEDSGESNGREFFDCMIDRIEYDEEADDYKNEDIVSDFDDILSSLAVDELFEEDDMDSRTESVLATKDDEEEEGEEIEEDISHLITIDQGVFTYHDPESGESIVLGSLDEDEDMDAAPAEHDDDLFLELNLPRRVDNAGGTPEAKRKKNVETLQIGDEVDVYIQAVSKQSGRFLVTTSPDVQSMKELKREKKVSKHMERLLNDFGGDINNIMKLKGSEGEARIKAKSQTGDWFYVEPSFLGLTVGIGQLREGLSEDVLEQGDLVLVRLNGVDSSRGQLSFSILDKI